MRVFPIEGAREDEINGIELKITKPMSGKIGGRGVTIKNGKQEEWYPADIKLLKQRFHTSDYSKIIDRINRLVEVSDECPRLPVPSLETEMRKLGLLNDDERKWRKLTKNTIEIEAILTEEVDSGFKYGIMRKTIIDQIMSAKTKEGKPLFEDVMSCKVEKQKDSVKVIAKIDKNTIKVHGGGMKKEEAIQSLISGLEAAFENKELPKGAIAIDYLINVESKDS